MKTWLKLFGMEVLYFFILNILAFILVQVQCIGKVYVGTYSSFIFSGKVYEYNTTAYIAGTAVFVICVIVFFKCMLKKRVESLANTGIGLKLLWVMTALFFCACMIITICFGLFCSVGLSSNPKPGEFQVLTIIGWPLLGFIYSIAMMMSRGKLIKRDETKM